MPNEVTLYNHEELGAVRTLHLNNEAIFVAKDLCQCLDIKNHSDALQRIDPEDIVYKYLDTKGGKQRVAFVNESGMYQLIFMSRKEGAKKFKRWVTSEVLPSIRKTGQYNLPKGIREEDVPEIDRMVREWSQHIDTILIKELFKGE